MASFGAGMIEGLLAALVVIVGIAAIAGLVAGGRRAASWHRSRRRPRPGTSDDDLRHPTAAELERRRQVLRALAAGQYLERRRDKDQ